MPLTTAARVRQLLGLESWEGDDTAITQFISDGEIIIEGSSGQVYTATDDDYNLAAIVCTEIAAQLLLPGLIKNEPNAEKVAAYHQIFVELTGDIARDLSHLVKRIRLPNKEIPLARNTIR